MTKLIIANGVPAFSKNDFKEVIANTIGYTEGKDYYLGTLRISS